MNKIMNIINIFIIKIFVAKEYVLMCWLAFPHSYTHLSHGIKQAFDSPSRIINTQILFKILR
jgi:hypothetical protein